MKFIVFILFFTIIISCNKQPTSNSTDNNITFFETKSDFDTVNLIKKEKQILEFHTAILKAAENDRNDSLIVINSKRFTDSMSDLIKNNPNTFNYSFELLQKENAINLISSADDNLRVYSWNNHLGGTMRFFNQIFQFKSNEQITVDIHLAEKDPQAFFSKIYEVKNSKKETFYLVISNSILSSKYSVQHINAYKIDTGKLNKIQVFKTKTNTLDQISVEYDFFSVVDRPERPVEVITLENNTLKIALVDNKQNVTSKNLIYEWDGEYFVYKGVR